MSLPGGTNNGGPPASAPTEGGARLSKGFAVVLGDEGAQLPARHLVKAVPLGPRALTLFSLLSSHPGVSPDRAAAVAEDLGAPGPEDLGSAIDAVRRAGLLIDDPEVGAGSESLLPPPLPPRPKTRTTESLSYPVPCMLRLVDGSFEALDHHGAVRLRLHPLEVAAAAAIAAKGTLDQADALQRERLGSAALDRDHLEGLASALVDAGLATEGIHVSASEARSKLQVKRVAEQLKLLRGRAREVSARFAEDERTRLAAGGAQLVPVVPVQPMNQTPLALGMVIDYAKAFDGEALQQHYAFVPSWLPNLPATEAFLGSGAVILFSNYIWSHENNLKLSKEFKAKHPANIVVHGGPNTPKYEGDVEAYFRDHSDVDILVHGEGEETFARVLERLVGTAGTPNPDLDVLEGVEGISFRSSSGAVVRGGDRDRITDLDLIPSPYLTGLFEAFEDGATGSAIIETNRGCPYSCTYCDWGSATASRIRKFSLERIFAELDWCGRNKVEQIFVADANYGIFERDVAVAEHLAEVHRTYGYPKVFVTNYAKNTVKHLHKIVQVLADAGIITEGLLSLQTMDTVTLDTIRRSNIKVEKYDLLAAEFREARLPLLVDLMLGLPGSTTTSTREDFQQCIDREVNAKIFQTEVLVNSPMNAPDYKAEHQIKTKEEVAAEAGAPRPRNGPRLIVSSSSFTQDDYEQMLRLRNIFVLFESFATLRIVARFVRQDAGIREVDLHEAIRQAVYTRPDDWPALTLAVRSVPTVMVPPVSWRLFIDEVEQFLVTEMGVSPSSGLAVALAAQHAVIPARDRTFPYSVELAHDVGAWYDELIAAKDAGHRLDWPEVVPALSSFGPATFTVTDESRLCEVGLGFRLMDDPYYDWELDSPTSRALVQKHALDS